VESDDADNKVSQRKRIGITNQKGRLII